MKTLLSLIAIASMCLSLDLNGAPSQQRPVFNGIPLNGIDPTVNLYGLAQAPLVKAD